MKTLSAGWLNSISLVALLLTGAVLAEEVNSVVAKVGDRSITSVELDRYISPTLKSYAKLMPNDPQIKEELQGERVNALKTIIDTQLLVKEAERLEVNIPPIEIDKQLAKERENYASEEEFQAYLRENKVTLEEFRKHIADSFKAQAILSEKVFKRVRILPHEIHKFYLENKDLLYSREESVHLYQILIKPDEGEPTARSARERANDLRTMILNGVDFQQVALQYSEGPMRDNGGDWGLIERGHFGEEMAAVEQAAFNLNPGECSDVLETRFGYHIVYVSARQKAHIQTEREAYDDIYRRLAETKSASVYEPYMNGLRRKTGVEIFDPTLKAAKPNVTPGMKIGDILKKSETASTPKETGTETETSDIKVSDAWGNSEEIKSVEIKEEVKPQEKDSPEKKTEEKAEVKIEEKTENNEAFDSKVAPADLEDTEAVSPTDVLKDLDRKIDEAATRTPLPGDTPVFETREQGTPEKSSGENK